MAAGERHFFAARSQPDFKGSMQTEPPVSADSQRERRNRCVFVLAGIYDATMNPNSDDQRR
jgi:hypothetical protein